MSGPINRESDKFMLRLPEGMREQIKAEAEANHRSMNAEIVARLAATFDANTKYLQHRILHPMTEADRLKSEMFSHRTTAERIAEIQRLLAELADQSTQE